MTTKHKHYDLIMAWANGAEIECFDGQLWVGLENPRWYFDDTYRIKVKPKPDVVLYACSSKLNDDNYATLTSAWNLNFSIFSDKKPNLKLLYDGETKELKAVELI